MSGRLAVVGAPSSAGAYAPGQEKAPAALRAIGLMELLSAAGITVDDRGDVSGFRWRADKTNPRAMNASIAATVARAPQSGSLLHLLPTRQCSSWAAIARSNSAQ